MAIEKGLGLKVTDLFSPCLLWLLIGDFQAGSNHQNIRSREPMIVRNIGGIFVFSEVVIGSKMLTRGRDHSSPSLPFQNNYRIGPLSLHQ